MSTATKRPDAAPQETPPPNPEALRARCYDPEWQYTPRDSTDLAATFKRIRKQMKDAEKAAEAEKKLPHIPTPIKRRA